MVSAHVQRELKKLYHPYFIINYLFISVFFITKTISPICEYLYETCHMELGEYQILIFLASIVTLRSKRYPTIVKYISHFCMFAKFANMIMFFQQNVLYALIYGLLWLLQIAFLHEPVYKGEDKVIYFNATALKEEMEKRDPNKKLLIEFYTAWSPKCVDLAPCFAELSQYYGTDKLQFGKIDVSRNPEVAAQYKVDTSNWSNNLPTIILFQSGKEVVRRPTINIQGRVMNKFVFSYENIVQAFDLNGLLQSVHDISSIESKKSQ